MSTHLGTGRPVMAAESEREHLRALEGALVEQDGVGPTVVAADGTSVEMPEIVTDFMRRVVHALAKGQAVQLAVYLRDLMMFEVADLLGESRATVERLIAEGHLPVVGDEDHRRIRLDDAMAHMARRDADRRDALRRLTEINQELGLYSTPTENESPVGAATTR